MAYKRMGTFAGFKGSELACGSKSGWCAKNSFGGSQALEWESERSNNGSKARNWLRTKANSIEGGTSEVMLNVVSKRILEMPGG